MNVCMTMITTARRPKHPSSGANRPSDVAVTVNINAEFHLMAVNSIIEWLSRDPNAEYCQGLDSSAVSTAPPVLVETLPCRSNRSLPRLPLHMHTQPIIPTFLMSNICIGRCLPKSLTLTWPRSYKMLEVLPIIRINKSMCDRRILNFCLQRVAFPYRLVKWITLKEGVPQPLKFKVRTLTPDSSWTVLALQISLNVWLPPRLPHSDSQWILQPPRRVQSVVTHQHRRKLNPSHCIQPCIWHCYHSHSSLWFWQPAYPHPLSRSPHGDYKSTVNLIYRKLSETEAVAIAITGGVYISINGLR